MSDRHDKYRRRMAPYRGTSKSKCIRWQHLFLTVVAETVSHPLLVDNINILPILIDSRDASVRHWTSRICCVKGDLLDKSKICLQMKIPPIDSPI